MTNTRNAFGWGLIGIGRHANRFIAPAIARSSKGRLTAVFSRDMERAKMFAERHGSPSVYNDLDALLKDERVSGVFISSPNFVHKEHVLLAAQAGKHVLCEKPLALTVEDCLEMIKSCDRAGVKLGVGFNLRHNPTHILAKEMITSGSIGELVLAEIQYMHVRAGEEKMPQVASWRKEPKSAGGGSFMGTGPHAIDLLRFVLGREITHVFALADASWDVSGFDQIIQASLLMTDHRVASLSAGNLKYPSNQLVIYGTLGTLRCTGSIGYTDRGRVELVSEKGITQREFEKCDVYVTQVDSFVESVHAGVEPNASGYDGLQCAKVTCGIYESLRSKRLVVLSP